MTDTIKRIAIGGAIAAAGLFGYLVLRSFGISEQTIVFVVLAAWGLLSIIQMEKRISVLEERVIHKDYSAIKSAIREGVRHKPKHDQPKSLADGGAIKSFITASHELLFDDFRWFGAVLNQHISEGWAVEEINDTDVRGFDGPRVGRRYHVFYNAWKMGTIQVTIGGSDWISSPEEFAANRRAEVELYLDNLRFVPFDSAHSLVATLALYAGQSDQDYEKARKRAANIANAALIGHLWESVRNPDFDTMFEFRTEGPYEALRQLVAHWKANDVDPYKQWGGDRSWDTEGA
ncbi:hypothetical protein [Mesorhizobium sp.]|uniref:hypothetical protein n=1 Tax=Mesorhizobium sp. TaxID=1871066 RepID=UPI000FE8E4E5|nr:hypothetical protein [Mesorhizobium sp.]RWB65395.1 MAG: hypothetical protein EOQ49_32230 [Mesorhizobium sp.]